jgi:hypothetical protein
MRDDATAFRLRFGHNRRKNGFGSLLGGALLGGGRGLVDPAKLLAEI